MKLGLERTIYSDLHDVVSKIQYWCIKAPSILRMRSEPDRSSFDDAEDALVAIYAAILEYQVGLAHFSGLSTIGMSPSHGHENTNKPTASLGSTIYATNEISELKKEIDRRHTKCESCFDRIAIDREVQVAERDTLDWITQQDMADIHREVMAQTGTDDLYDLAGEWLLSLPMYQDWYHGEDQVFWLCGAGEYSQHI